MEIIDLDNPELKITYTYNFPNKIQKPKQEKKPRKSRIIDCTGKIKIKKTKHEIYKKYYEKNKNKIQATQKIYRQNNPGKIKEIKNAYRKRQLI